MHRVIYPIARRAAASYALHGRTIPEPYDYLENPADPETRSFVAQQNEKFSEYMKSSADVRDKIRARIESVQNYTRVGAPSLHGSKYYFSLNTGLQNQSVIMRADSPDRTDDAEVFFDPNALSADGTTALKASAWSESEQLYAYSVSDKGSDWQRIHVRGVDGADLEENIQWAKFTGIAWWKDYGFFYTRYPALGDDVDKGAETDSAQNAFICFHAIGTPQSEDVEMVRVPEQPLWSLAAEVSDCNKFVIVSLFDGCEPHNLIWIAELPEDPAALRAKPLEYVKLVNEFVGEYGYLGNDGDSFYFSSTKDAPRKKVVSINVRDGSETLLVPEQESVLNAAALSRSTLLLVYLEDVKDVVYYRRLDEPELHRLDLPIGSIVSIFSDRKKDFVSFKMSSFLLPGRSYTLDITDPQGSLQVLRDDVVAGLNANDYTTEQRFYHSDDGTRIPMFIIHKKGAVTAESPVLLYGYGGFGISLTPSFNPSRVVFLQNLAGVLAIPNIRGGGEYGQTWHDAGRRANKQNCFTDFIAAARYLHQNDIGSPATTAIMGGSNGGLLVAAVANQAPGLLRCVVCQVGVLDMYKFHKFTIGHAWISDYGDPDVEADFAVVEKFSPIHNVREGVEYPAILVVTGDHDDRVVPLHSLKYIATLQHANPEKGGPFLARVEVAAGHGAGKPTSKIIEESSDIYAFIAKNIGAKWTE